MIYESSNAPLSKLRLLDIDTVEEYYSGNVICDSPCPPGEHARVKTRATLLRTGEHQWLLMKTSGSFC